MGHNKLVESVCGKSGMKEVGTTANQGQKEAESPPSPSRPCSLGSPALYVCGHHLLLNVPCGLPRYPVSLPRTLSIRKHFPVSNMALPRST